MNRKTAIFPAIVVVFSFLFLMERVNLRNEIESLTDKHSLSADQIGSLRDEIMVNRDKQSKLWEEVVDLRRDATILYGSLNETTKIITFGHSEEITLKDVVLLLLKKLNFEIEMVDKAIMVLEPELVQRSDVGTEPTVYGK